MYTPPLLITNSTSNIASPVCGPFKHTECLLIFKCTYVNFTFILFVTKKVCKVRLYLKLQLTINEIRTHRAYTKIVKNLIWTKRIIRVYAINYN